MSTPDLDRKELMRLAVPLYRAELEAIPFYRGWSDAAWEAYVGSRYVQAQERVAAHLAGEPWPPEA